MKVVKQGLRELQDILTWQTCAEHDSQQFCISERVTAHLKQSFARAGCFGYIQ
jgi:hypothetical protein